MTDKKRSNRDIFLRVLEILNTGEIDSVDEVFDKDIVMDWPQTRERVKGLENYKAIVRNYPGSSGSVPSWEAQVVAGGDEGRYLLTPMFTAVKVEGTGDTVVTSAMMKYPDGSDWYVISLATIRDGKIIKLVQYFAPLYEAPEWRSQWVERIES